MNDVVENGINANKRVESLVKAAFIQYGENTVKVNAFLERPIAFDGKEITPLEMARGSVDGYDRAISHLSECTRNYAPAIRP